MCPSNDYTVKSDQVDMDAHKFKRRIKFLRWALVAWFTLTVIVMTPILLGASIGHWVVYPIAILLVVLLVLAIYAYIITRHRYT